MMAEQPGRPPLRQILLWLALALLLVFVALIAYQVFFINRLRFVPDADLLAELADVTLEEDTTAGLDEKVWLQWRGQRRDGVATAKDFLVDWPRPGPQQLWRFPGGDGYSSFAVAGDSAYSMMASRKSQEAVVCWAVGNGAERWQHSYDPGATFDYGGPRATPTVAGKRLFAFSSSGVLMCLNPATGKPLWEQDLRQELGAVAPRWGFACSPLVEEGRVFVTPGGSNRRCLAAFDLEGKLLWASEDDPAGYSSPIAMTAGGVPHIVFFTGRRLLGVTPDEGKLLWDFAWNTKFEVNAATPVVIHGISGKDKEELTWVFISSGYGKGCALVKISARQGRFKAKAVYESNAMCCHFASPVRHGEYLYGLDETRDLTCLSIRTGEVMWRQSGFQKGSLMRIDDRLLVLGENGRLALVECNPKEYRELARTRPFRDRCWTLPVLADGRLFLRDRREVLCLDLRKR
jgi:outer membrane protein assembly factor BamB